MTAELPHRDGLRTASVAPASRHRSRPRHHVPAAALIASAMLLSACGGGASKASDAAEAKPKQNASSTASSDFDGDDVMFLQMLIAQRQQTIEMVKLAPGRSRRADVQQLAATVEKESAAEVQQMSSWLTGWSKPTTLQGPANSHAAHGGLPAVGPAEMRALKQAEGRNFDLTFFNLLLSLQHNAVELAQVEIKKGISPTAKAHATRVVQTTSGRISQLLRLLNS